LYQAVPVQGKNMKSLQSRTVKILRDCDGYEADIANVVEKAFRAQYGKGDGEASLIVALREDGLVVAEFVAAEEGAVVGHAMFSRMTAEPAWGQIAALGPVCARLDRRRSGIASALIRAGLDACRAKDVAAVIVLGDPDYYGRFGFRAAKADGIACAFAGPDLQALELVPGALKDVTALSYAPAFSAV
jgi:putative acetyltransferase